MNFNFYDEYSDYSNIELLKILKQPGIYQAAAIDAATQILKKREISEDETGEIERYFQDIQTNEQLKKEKINSYKEKANNFLQPILQPGAEIKPARWLHIFFVIVGLQYLFILYKTIKGIVFFAACQTCRFDVSVIFEFSSLVYVPIIFYLLYKKKRWGWILLFADNLVGLILRVSQSYIFFKYLGAHHTGTSSFLFPIFIKTALIIFLWGDEIARFFKVTNNTKKNTALVATVVALLFLGAMYMLYPA